MTTANTALDQLKALTTVVADTGDFERMKQFAPQDATTNPSLILKAIQQPQYLPLAQQALSYAADYADGPARIALAADKLAVLFGQQLLQQVPGFVSTEVDARLSFNSMATIEKAHQLLDMYQAQGADISRVLIKVAATWEGIQAARVLEQQGIQCNLTLLFHMAQARACAEAGAYLISPFVGRILDWYKASTGKDYTADTDPGVLSVRDIYRFYKQHGYKTVVMGASFRNTGEVLALAGCDRLTISPALLAELSQQQGELTVHLRDEGATTTAPAALTESEFRWALNEDAMATEKLSEGIRKFAIDQRKLEQVIQQAL